MMCSIEGLFANNRAWANQRVADDPSSRDWRAS